MITHAEFQAELRVLSEHRLYDEAVAFASQHRGIRHSQLQGLQQYSRRWSELQKYVEHRRERSWSDTSPYHAFYGALARKLQDICDETQSRFVPDDLTKAESRALTEELASQVIAEFVQHLVAEMVLQGED